MNKKFIKASLIICVPLILMLGLFSVTVKNEDVFEELNNSIEIVYKGYTETKDSYNVSIIVKNKSKNIASMSDMELSFLSCEGDSSDFYIKGYEKDFWSENKGMGIDSGEEEEFVFEIPKAIKIDEKYYNMNTINIGYNADFFKFRTSPSSLFLGVGQMGGTRTIGEGY